MNGDGKLIHQDGSRTAAGTGFPVIFDLTTKGRKNRTIRHVQPCRI